MMWNTDSHHHQQSILNEYSQSFIYQKSNCKRFFQEVSKRRDRISSPSKSVVISSICSRSSLLNGNNEPTKNKIKDLQIHTMRNPTINADISCKGANSKNTTVNGNSAYLPNGSSTSRKPGNKSTHAISLPNLDQNHRKHVKLKGISADIDDKEYVLKSSQCPSPKGANSKNTMVNGNSAYLPNGSSTSRKPGNKSTHAISLSNLDQNHRKHVKLKDISADIDDKEYVLKSSQRLQYISSIDKQYIPPNNSIIEKILGLQDSHIEIKIIRRQSVVGCQSKSMRSSPGSTETSKREGNESKKQTGNSIKVVNSGAFNCEWHDCSCSFKNVEGLTKHVKSEHINPTMDNDVFVCLWRACKFTNQPSCSFKWLSKHVIRHCDLKPFKCVISGCDMTFVTQSGLARHVPTHFNESRVRRACVITSEASAKNESYKPRRSLNATLDSCSEVNRENGLARTKKKGHWSKVQYNEHQNETISKNYTTFTSKTYSYIKKKIQLGTCNPATNSGYLDKVFRIEHKVIGRRSDSNGTSNEMLLTPSLNNLFPHSSFWCDATEFRKRKHTYIDVHMKDMSVDIKNKLFDMEHASSLRRRKKRK